MVQDLSIRSMFQFVVPNYSLSPDAPQIAKQNKANKKKVEALVHLFAPAGLNQLFCRFAVFWKVSLIFLPEPHLCKEAQGPSHSPRIPKALFCLNTAYSLYDLGVRI